MAEPQKTIFDLFENISNILLTGDVEGKVILSECGKLAELVNQINESKDNSKTRRLEATIAELTKMKEALGQGVTSKPLDEAMQKYTAELEALKKAATKAPAATKWVQQVGKKLIPEDAIKFKKFKYGLGTPIEVEAVEVDDDTVAPAGYICRRRRAETFFVIINGQTCEIPQCYFHVEGDEESDTFTNVGTKFYNADLDNGKQDMSRYADVSDPSGLNGHAPHQVNKSGVNRIIRKIKFIPRNAALAEQYGLASSFAIDLFSCLNIRIAPAAPKKTVPFVSKK